MASKSDRNPSYNHIVNHGQSQSSSATHSYDLNSDANRLTINSTAKVTR